MRKTLFLFSMFVAFSSTAQVEPLSQFLNKAMIPQLVVYDSIALSQDSGANFNPFLTAAQHYFTNGHIDTLTIEAGGSSFLEYDGRLDGRTTSIRSTLSGSNSFIDSTVFRQDVLYRDSIIEYYPYQMGTFTLGLTIEVFYTNPTGKKLDKLVLKGDTGSGFQPMGDFHFYYGTQGLDSVYYTLTATGASDGYYKYTYDPNIAGRLKSYGRFEDFDNDGERELFQEVLFKNNSLNQVVELSQTDLDTATSTFFLTANVRYAKRKNSTISLPELGEVRMSLYPNPTHDQLKLEFDEKVFTEYHVVSVNGTVVQRGKAQSVLDVSHLNSGMYILKLSGDKGAITNRFYKM